MMKWKITILFLLFATCLGFAGVYLKLPDQGDLLQLTPVGTSLADADRAWKKREWLVMSRPEERLSGSNALAGTARVRIGHYRTYVRIAGPIYFFPRVDVEAVYYFDQNMRIQRIEIEQKGTWP